MFPGHYRPTAGDFDEMWRNGLFVLDANVLLNLYRYSDDTRQELLRILRVLQDNLWLPYRAASEYLSSRVEEVHQQRKKYEDRREEIDAIKEKVAESTKGLHRDSVVEAEDLLEEVRSGLVVVDLIEEPAYDRLVLLRRHEGPPDRSLRRHDAREGQGHPVPEVRG